MQSPQLRNRAAPSTLAPALNQGNAPDDNFLDAPGSLNNTERRRNTAPAAVHLQGITLHTPPPTASSSIDVVHVTAHASSETRYCKPDRTSLTSAGNNTAAEKRLPQVARPLAATKSSETTRTNPTISRSARIPLRSSPFTSPATLTPTVPPIPPNVLAPCPTATQPLLTRTPPTSSNVVEEAPASVRNLKSMQDALKKFNARLLEENEKEEARKNRHNSRSNSWDSLMVVLPVAHSPLSVVSAPPPKHNPLHTPPSRDNSRSASSSSGGMIPTTLTSAASLPPRVTTVSQISPKPSSPRSSRVTATTTSSNHSSSSVPASVPRGSANSSESGTTLHTTPSSPFFAQGLRCGLPRTVKLEQQQQQQQQLGSARTSQAAASPSHMRLSPTSSSRDEVNTPPIVDTPRPAKTVVGTPKIEAPRLPPSPRTASPAIPNLPGRYVQVSSADEQKNSQSTVENPLIGPMPLMPSPSPVVGPVYSAVEIQESTSLSTGSSNGRWGPSSDAKRPSVSSSNGGQAGADKTIITTTPGVSRATTLQPMRQPTQPVPRKNHRIDELNDIREEAPAEQSSATLSHNTPGALPQTSSPSSSASQNCGASNGRPPASPSRSDKPHDAGPHRLSHANSNGSDDSSPVTELPLFSSTDERPGKCSPNSAAAKETVATITAPKSPKFINSSPAAGQSPSSAASTRVPPLANGGSGGSLTQCPSSALNHSGRYSPARGNLNASTSAGRHANDQHQSSAGTAIPDDDAETAALSSYLMEEDLNLSLSTFNRIGSTLAQSLTLRVLNLKGSTISSEGLRGLADISTLKSVGVSHMRYLTTLAPLVTPTARANGRHCGIEEIDAQFSPLTNEGIGGLEKLRWLRRLDLSMTPISDVTCLAASHSLKDLYLSGTRVDSPGLAGLEQLPTLSLLNIARTKVTSLKQVAKSRSVQTLIAYSCQITDDGFIGVGEMPRLSTLDVSTTKVTNLSVLQKSPSLKSLRAQWLSLKNCNDIIQQRRAQMDGLTPDSSVAWRDTEVGFAGLANIPTLESLDMSFNTIRSLHSLCRSKSLKRLLLRRTRVDNDGIGGIAQLAGTLETLVITNLTDILDENDETEAGAALNGASGLLSSIGDIHSMHRLTSIDLSFTDVYDLRLLQDLRTLRELVIVETLVTVDGLRGIEKIPTLETLDISQTSILSLQFLTSGAPALKSILVKSNRNVRGFKLGRIDELRALQHLDVSDTVVEDIEAALKSAWRLKKLVWRWKDRRDSKGPAPALECWVTSPRLARMNAMPCLTTLDLTNSSVHDLAFLERSTSLTTLYLKCCRLLRNSAVKSLGTLPGLEVLELTDNRHISDVTCLRTCRRLRELHLNHTYVTKAGLKGVTDLPDLKVLDIVNTRAEDDVKDEDVNGAMERSRLLEDSNLREGSTLLDSSAAPAQFRVPRRRRVSFVASDGSEAVPRKSDRCE